MTTQQNEMKITEKNWKTFDYDCDGIRIYVWDDDNISVETKRGDASFTNLADAIEFANEKWSEMNRVMTMDNWDEFTVEEDGVCVYIDDDGIVWTEDGRETNQEDSLESAIDACNRALEMWRSGR